MKKKFNILTVNPGSTSTKIALFQNEDEIFEKTIRHSNEELAPYKKITDQFSFRKELIVKVLQENGVELDGDAQDHAL